MSATGLKLLALVFMLLDHIAPFVPSGLALLFHFLSRFVLGTYAFLAAEGYFYTRSKKNYLKRLYVAALIMAIGNYLMNSFVITNPEYHVNNSMFLSIAIGVSVLTLKDDEVLPSKIRGLLLILLLNIAIFSEGGTVTIVIMLIYNKYREDFGSILKYFFLAFLLRALMFSFEIFDSSLDLFYRQIIFIEIFAYPLTLPFIKLYNGKKGEYPGWIKYLFYVFYPLHLWIIGFMTNYIV